MDMFVDETSMGVGLVPCMSQRIVKKFPVVAVVPSDTSHQQNKPFFLWICSQNTPDTLRAQMYFPFGGLSIELLTGTAASDEGGITAEKEDRSGLTAIMHQVC